MGYIYLLHPLSVSGNSELFTGLFTAAGNRIIALVLMNLPWELNDLTLIKYPWWLWVNVSCTNPAKHSTVCPSPLKYRTVYPKKYAHGFCFAVLCCGYTLTDFPISIRLNSLALWQSNDCPSASKATLMNMDNYFMWIHYERLHNHNKAKHNKTVCIFLGIYCCSSHMTNQ